MALSFYSAFSLARIFPTRGTGFRWSTSLTSLAGCSLGPSRLPRVQRLGVACDPTLNCPTSTTFSQNDPQQLHFAIAVVNYRTRMAVPRSGVFTTWLATLKPEQGAALRLWTQPGTFKVPTNATPLILVGPGRQTPASRPHPDPLTAQAPAARLCAPL